MKKVTVLLTKYTDFWGRFARGITGKGYSHASISLDENEEIFYSFNAKGFAIEKPKKYWPKKKLPGSMYIRISVPQAIYDSLENSIRNIQEEKHNYAFSKFGLFLCYLNIPHTRNKKYFCSQFVAEMLSRNGIAKLKKSGSLYVPNNFINDIVHYFPYQQTFYQNL